MNEDASSLMDTRINEFGPGVLEKLGPICDELFGDRPLLVVSDQRIWSAEGGRLDRALAGRNPKPEIRLLPASPPPYADDNLVAHIRGILGAGNWATIAFGSGTINDVVKRASFELGRPYLCVPTAPSVDGYTSFGASITVGGTKMTLKCPAPLAIVADEDLLARAPQEMISAGFGDLVAKVAAGVDWMIADAIGAEKIDAAIFNLVQPGALAILTKGGAVGLGDKEAIGDVYRGLVASGIAMQRYRDSRPASGAEHLLSHVWEMDHLTHEGAAPSHGFKVAVGTIAMISLQRRFFAMDGAVLKRSAERADKEPLEARLAAIETLLPAGRQREEANVVVRAKTLTGAALDARRATFLSSKESLGARVLARLPSIEALKQSLAAAGCPTNPRDIGLTPGHYLRAMRTAVLIRKRYTILDLAADFGMLEELAEGIAGSEFPNPS